jgi:hypothetical protein
MVKAKKSPSKHATKRPSKVTTRKVAKKPAAKERKGINPFTGQETVFKAKPKKSMKRKSAAKKRGIGIGGGHMT